VSNLKNRAGRFLSALLSRFVKQRPSPISDEFIVNGLPLPPLLISLIQQGKWKHPGEDVLHSVIPFLHDKMDFMTPEQRRSETEGQLEIVDLPIQLPHMRQARGSKASTPLDLPWLDVEKMVFLAIGQQRGDDEAIALDYRTSTADPRVIACESRAYDGFYWREVTPTFTEFVERLGLNDVTRK
jgi:hypothetical protein